jgi:hypothetical protein
MTTQPETVSDLFPSRWLAPADLRGRSVTLTITAVAVEQRHNPRTHKPEPKAVLDFGRSIGCARHSRLPLNRAQCLALAALAGSERFADWPGLRVTLHPATAPNGKPTIRITKEGWALTAGPALSNLTATENKPHLTA